MIAFPSDLELAARLALAALLGGLIGLEREVSDHPAGVRTHMSVALGACLFGIASAYGFGPFDVVRSGTNFHVDPTRVASNIVTGVGFLGGGAIVKYGATVKGLTTAASLWVTAAIGLGVALGTYVATLVTFVLLLVSLVGLHRPSRWLARRYARDRETVVVHLHDASGAGAVVSALTSLPTVALRSLQLQEHEGECLLELDVEATAGTRLEVALAPLAAHPDVRRFSFG